MNKSSLQPRLNDYFDLTFSQDDVDFAIPQLVTDIPLSIDPFLLWSSSNLVYAELHRQLLAFFEHVRQLVLQNRQQEALQILLKCGEPRELGLGFARRSKRGSSIGIQLASAIVSMYQYIPQVSQNGLNHIEETQLVIPGIAADRVSDITYSVLKHYFIEYTVEQANRYNIPTKTIFLANMFDHNKMIWKSGLKINLPYNPIDQTPIVFVPLNILRHLPWISYEDYYKSVFSKFVLPPDTTKKIGKEIRLSKPEVQSINRNNYQQVQYYVHLKEQQAEECKPDPFTERDFLERGLTEAMRTLRVLEKQAAGFGSLHIPAHLVIQIEDKKIEVREWEDKIRVLRDKEAA